MLNTLLMIAALLGAPTESADTVIAVEAGMRLDVNNRNGEVVVHTWGRDAVRIRADLSSRERVDVVRSGSVLRVRTHRDRGRGDAELEIDVPRWMDVAVEGTEVDVTVSGAEGEVAVETVSGDIDVNGGRGLVTLRSVQGEIVLRGASGRIEAVSVNEDVELQSVDGEIQVETTNGDVEIRDARAGVVRAFTMNGDVTYDGTIQDGGRYVFTTHNGDVRVVVPEDASATVSVATYQGEFESEFPIRLTGTSQDRQFTFTLGSGSARIELESFNGEINLIRP
jgi:DUF4097 and DUF4098 domain-containing protein YvlB